MISEPKNGDEEISGSMWPGTRQKSVIWDLGGRRMGNQAQVVKDERSDIQKFRLDSTSE